MDITIAELAARLRRLEDLEAIRALIAAYGPLADSGCAEELAALWHEDGSYRVAGLPAALGRIAIADLIESDEHRGLMTNGCAHLLGPVTINLDGDRAVARGHSVVLRHVNGGFDIYRVSANRWELARGADGWQVASRRNALLDGNAAARALLSPDGREPNHPAS